MLKDFCQQDAEYKSPGHYIQRPAKERYLCLQVCRFNTLRVLDSGISYRLMVIKKGTCIRALKASHLFHSIPSTAVLGVRGQSQLLRPFSGFPHLGLSPASEGID